MSAIEKREEGRQDDKFVSCARGYSSVTELFPCKEDIVTQC